MAGSARPWGLASGVVHVTRPRDTAADPGPPAPSVRKNMILALACLGQFMVVLDVSIVNVALPAMRRDLDFSATGLQWVVNAYTLTFAGFQLLGGRMADLYGRRRIFLLGLGMFTAASLVCGLAPGPETLIGARAIQGLGAAVLAPATLTILTATFTESRERSRALGLWSASLASGGATGALFGGLLVQYLSWRWIFFINLPIGIFGLLAARTVLAESRGAQAARSLDVGGALTITGALTALVYGVVRSDTSGWTSPETLAALAVAAVLLATFLWLEARVARAPLVPLGLLRSRGLAGANLAMLCVGGSMFAMWYFVSLYLQGVLGHGPLRAGLEFIPAALAVIVGAQASGRLLHRLGPRPLLAGAALICAAGLVWLSRLSPTGTYAADVLGPLTLVALGLGLSFPPGTYAATAGVAAREGGLASGLVNTTRQVGGAVGLAALATIAVDRTKAVLAGGRPGPGVVNDALTAGYARAFEVAAVIALGACAAAFVIPAREPRGRAEPAPAGSVPDARD
jgi:EmrB/QacA subfamily drug resistance transporter